MQQKKPLRVVVDTNIWISFLIGKTLSDLTEAITQDEVCLFFSEELFEEFLTVVQRPKFARYFSADAVRELIALLQAKATWVDVTEIYHDCRDAKDNFLLDLNVSEQADYLVTGDGDLRALNPFHGTQIITYRGSLKTCCINCGNAVFLSIRCGHFNGSVTHAFNMRRCLAQASWAWVMDYLHTTQNAQSVAEFHTSLQAWRWADGRTRVAFIVGLRKKRSAKPTRALKSPVR